MRMAFLAKYADFGLLLLRVSIGVLFLLYTAPVLLGGPNAWGHFGAGVRNFGIHSHFQLWGFIGALLGSIGGVLVIFGLFFRPGILVLMLLAIAHAIGVKHSNGFRVALPSIEICFVLAGILFVGPGKYSVDKT
jgi:putative oxidoreductase